MFWGIREFFSATFENENIQMKSDMSLFSAWTPEDVINNFVEKIGLGYLNEAFLANKITGRALMLLNEV